MSSGQEAVQAIENLSGKEIDNRKCCLTPAEEQPDLCNDVFGEDA
jgi:hypothetical protein